MMSSSIYGVVVINGSLYSRFYGLVYLLHMYVCMYIHCM